MFFEHSRAARAKKAKRDKHRSGAVVFSASEIPSAIPCEFLTHADLTETSLTLSCDVEAYVNYFLVGFQDVASRKVVYFEIDNESSFTDQQLGNLYFVILRHRIITFNGNNYDLQMIKAALSGLPCWKLKEISDEIILEEKRPFELERKYGFAQIDVNHIDLIEVAPIQASLKQYSARLHCKRLQDLPYQHNATLSDAEKVIVRDYNLNDLDLTTELFDFLAPQISLREAVGARYGTDLRSKSDAQVSEAVIGSELRKLGIETKPPKIAPGHSFSYQVPDFISYKTPQLQAMLERVKRARFVVQDSGSIDLPPELSENLIELGQSRYQMGIGGLHSTEKSVGHVADENTLIIDRDVASFYPYIILLCRLYPQHLGPAFLEVYNNIVKQRIAAKLAKDLVTADGLKITINGGFGKLGNKYSIFYSPDLLIQVTVTGQLSLLMFIEMVELAGISVVSANTDGIVIKCPKSKADELETVVLQWEERTGFLTEETRYASIWSRDVNNYIAVKLKQDPETKEWLDEIDGCKTKGVYGEVGSALNSPLSKNPEAYICSMAVQQFLAYGVPVEDTIYSLGEGVKTKHYKDPITRFISVKRVKGGAAKNGQYLGKVVRWYYATGETGTIETVTHGSTVPKSEGGKPIMSLPLTFPTDINFNWYVDTAIEELYSLGRYQRATTPRLL